MSLTKLIDTAKFTISEIVVAYLVGVIATGGNPLTLAKIILAIKLNVFALPLAHTPALSMPLWCWYIVVVLWIRQWLYYSEYDVADVVSQLEDDVAMLTSSPSETVTATDGGEDRAE